MSEVPNSTDVLRSLRLLRSDDPAERQRAVATLSNMLDDPRVVQVFEYLYEKDPDPTVRDMTWRAINQAEPSIPTPVPNTKPAPIPEPPQAGKTAPPPRPKPAPTKRPAAAARSRKPTTFLLNPANAKFVAKETREQARQRGGGRVAFGIAGVLVLGVIVLAVLVASDWIMWYRLHENGLEATGTITDLQVRSGRYYVLYTFDPAQNDVFYTGQQRISEETFNSITDDMLAQVTYLPDDPLTSRLDVYNPEDTTRDRLTIIMGGLALMALGLVITGIVQRQRRPDQRVIKGQMVACTGTLDGDGDFNLKVRYRFRSPSGQVFTGQTSHIRNDLKGATLPRPGTPVAVYYRSNQSYLLL